MAGEKPLLTFQENVTFVNKHQNVKTQVQRLYDVWNRWEGGATPGEHQWQAGLLALRQIVRDAQAAGRRVRALGGAWSLSEAAACSDFMLNTKPLNYTVIGLSPSDCSAGFTGRPERLVFAQGGTSILELNEWLEERGLSLPTSGASNGQTIAGALSTGTHGAANQIGSMQDYMIGLHLIGENGRDIWLERDSRPGVSADFADNLGTTIVRDDALFRAAAVSFGSFGVLHAVLFEAVPVFLLEAYCRRFDYSALRHALTTLDVAALGLPDGAALPFHFEVVLNPYGTNNGDRGAFLRFMYKRPYRELPPQAPAPTVVTRVGDDALSIVGFLTAELPHQVPGAVTLLMSQFVSLAEAQLGTHGQTFGSTSFRGPLASCEIGVPAPQSADAIDVITDTIRRRSLPGLLGIRFVKSSDACLAFTRFSPLTCTIEIPATAVDGARDVYEEIWQGLERASIAFTLH
jgi:FAD/FMN-containing dehydrogenase